MTYKKLMQKKQALDALRPLPPDLVRNLEAWFKVELTFTSNALEGNTLTRRETAVVLEKGLTIGGKSLVEHLEANNHGFALDYVQTLASEAQIPIKERDILALHALILRGLDEENAGRYRCVPVQISGSLVDLPNPLKVPELMAEFLAWLGSEPKGHPVAFAAEAHYRLVTIHPFIDGNGRTARLLMNLLLLRAGYPPAIIRKRDRLAYLSALEEAQLGGAKLRYDKLISDAAERSLDIYLNAAQGKPRAVVLDGIEPTQLQLKTNLQSLLKIGTLAKIAGESVPTIRHWTKLGLLTIADTSQGGFNLYAPDMVARCQDIQRLKAKRLTLEEIAREVGG